MDKFNHNQRLILAQKAHLIYIRQFPVKVVSNPFNYNINAYFREGRLANVSSVLKLWGDMAKYYMVTSFEALISGGKASLSCVGVIPKRIWRQSGGSNAFSKSPLKKTWKLRPCRHT